MPFYPVISIEVLYVLLSMKRLLFDDFICCRALDELSDSNEASRRNKHERCVAHMPETNELNIFAELNIPSVTCKAVTVRTKMFLLCD